MQIRGARPVTLPAKGSRMAALGISLGGGGEKRGAEKRTLETRDPLERDASATHPTRNSMEYHHRYAEKRASSSFLVVRDIK